jgi:hypothetical protein
VDANHLHHHKSAASHFTPVLQSHMPKKPGYDFSVYHHAVHSEQIFATARHFSSNRNVAISSGFRMK